MQEKKKKITERWWVEMGNMLKAIKGLLKMFQMLWWIENWYGRLTELCEHYNAFKISFVSNFQFPNDSLR